MPKSSDYLKILIDEEVTDFVLKNFGKYFEYTREYLYSKLSKEKDL